MEKLQLTKIFGIYQIKNKLNGKRYIGSTIRSFSIRWAQWRGNLKRGTANVHLQNSWNKYGEEAFEFSILEIVEDKEKVIEREQDWIDTLKPEYNICPKAGNCAGTPRKYKGLRMKVRLCPMCNEEVKRPKPGEYRKTCGKQECINSLANIEGKLAHRIGNRSKRPCPICGNQRKECFTSKGEFNKYQKTCGNSECIKLTKGRQRKLK